MSAAAKKIAMDNKEIQVNGVLLKWEGASEKLTFAGIDSVLFWTKPSLASVLNPLREEVGEDLYSCLIAFEASRGTSEDYFSMINSSSSFETGFSVWAQAVSGAGWGHLFIESIDWEKREAGIRIENPWELRLFKSRNRKNDIPFLRGKLSGIFSLAFKTNCQVHVHSVTHETVLLRVAPSIETLEQALFSMQADGEGREHERLKAVNNALRRNERRLLDVAEIVGEFIWETDRYLNFSHLTERSTTSLGIEPAQILGRSWEDILEPREANRFSSLLETLDADRFVEGEFTILRPSGQRLAIFVRAKAVFDHGGNCCGYIGSGRDISHEKRLRSQLEEQQKSAEYAAKMATLGEMAAGIAHEINTPLAVIGLLAEQLTETLKGGTQTQSLVADSATILETSERIAKIVQGLKTFARDAAEDEFVTAGIEQILSDTLVLCASRLKNNGVIIETSVRGPIAPLYCRPTQLSQVILNLMNNAYDAIADQSEKWIRLEAFADDDKLILRVTDSGNGIPEHVRLKIMQPFFTTKPVGLGTGLGLSISKGIVETHLGRLWYDAGAKNTSFVIELPLRPRGKSLHSQ